MDDIPPNTLASLFSGLAGQTPHVPGSCFLPLLFIFSAKHRSTPRSVSPRMEALGRRGSGPPFLCPTTSLGTQ